MKAEKPNVRYQTVTLFVKYYDDGLMEYCNPYNGEVLFTKQSPAGTSPLIELASEKNVKQCDNCETFILQSDKECWRCQRDVFNESAKLGTYKKEG